MERVPLVAQDIASANVLRVEVGTNCPKGGDSGHGGRTVFRIINGGGTDMELKQPSGVHRHVESVEIVLSGDCECDTFIEALEFAAQTLRDLRARNSEAPVTDVSKYAFVN